MQLVADPMTVVQNVTALAAVIVILIGGLVAASHMAKHRFIGVVITIAGAALVYLAIKGTLIQDVSQWWQDIGL